MTRQEFRSVDVVRLDVQADDTPTTNLVKNPVPELGTYLWTTGNPAATLEVASSDAEVPMFRLGVVEASIAVTTHAPFRVTPGWVGVSAEFVARSTSEESARLFLFFLDAAGLGVSAYVSDPWAAGAPRLSLDAVPVPDRAVAASVAVGAFTNGSDLQMGRTVTFTKVAARQGTPAETTALPYTEPYEWLDIIGPTHDIKAVNAGLSLGLLTATIRSAALDPAVSPALRPGRLVRLSVPMYDPTTGEPVGTRRASLWRGKVLSGSTDYDLTQHDPDRRAKIQLTAVNAISQAASTLRDKGVKQIRDLAYLLEDAGVPWAIDGSGTQPSGELTYIFVTVDPKKSLLDQVAITRDSRRGFAWVDRRGVLNISSNDGRPTGRPIALGDDVCTGLTVGFDTTRCINSLTVHALAGSQEYVFGPYEDRDSIEQWGAHSADITVSGLLDFEIGPWAAAFLADNSTPAFKANTARYPVRTLADVASRRTLIDCYDQARVTNEPIGLDQTLRPVSVTHTLTAGVDSDKWVIDLEFAAEGTSPSPLHMPPPAGSSEPATTP